MSVREVNRKSGELFPLVKMTGEKHGGVPIYLKFVFWSSSEKKEIILMF